METLGVGSFTDGEWECFGRMFATEEHYAYASPQLLGENTLLLGEADGSFGVQSMFCTFDSDNNSDLQYMYQESSHIGNSHELAKSSDRSENFDHNQAKQLQLQLKLKRILDVPEFEMHVEDQIINSYGNPKKKSRASKDVKQCMDNAEFNEKESEETNASADGHSSSSYYTSEDQNTTCEENSGVTSLASKSTMALSTNGKTRASRGSATDPQSVYARKRRERINERLRILQNLVPNGTKVDISTMLEEAIHYVNFLQLQIKLLSSDDTWMYSPIAYNGLDIGLNLSQKISPPL